MIIIPIKWLFHWEYTLFSDKPIYIYIYNSIWSYLIYIYLPLWPRFFFCVIPQGFIAKTNHQNIPVLWSWNIILYHLKLLKILENTRNYEKSSITIINDHELSFSWLLMVIKLWVFHGRCLHVRHHCHRCHRKFGAASPWSKNEAQNPGVLWVNKDWVGGNVGLTWINRNMMNGYMMIYGWYSLKYGLWRVDEYDECWMNWWFSMDWFERKSGSMWRGFHWGLPWLEIFYYGSGSFWIYSEFWLSSLQSSKLEMDWSLFCWFRQIHGGHHS